MWGGFGVYSQGVVWEGPSIPPSQGGRTERTPLSPLDRGAVRKALHRGDRECALTRRGTERCLHRGHEISDSFTGGLASLCKGGVPKGRWVDKIIKNKLLSYLIMWMLTKSAVG